MKGRVIALVCMSIVSVTAAAAHADPLADATQAVAAQPRDPALRIKLGKLLAEQQRTAEAITAYEAAIQLDGTPAEPKLALAELYVRIGQATRAAALLGDVVRTSAGAMALLAGQRAIDLGEMTGTFDGLEQVMLPRATQLIHRRLLVDLYLRWLPRLFERARNHDAAARDELLRIGRTSLAPLTAALTDSDPKQPRAAIAVLARLGNPAAAPALVKLARSEPPGQPATDAAIELRSSALVAAGQLGGSAVFDAALPLLKHPALELRNAATFTIARTGDRRAIPLLIAALDDRPTIATLACLGLAQARDPRIGPVLLAVVSDAGHPDLPRAACAYAIGVQHLTAATPVLLRALNGTGELPRLAAWSLGQLRDPAALAPLLEAYFASGSHTRDAVAGGAPVGDRAREPLAQARGHERAELELAIALVSGAPAPAIPALEPTAYPQRNGRYDAAYTVATLPGVVPTLSVPDGMFPAHASELGHAIANALAASDPAIVIGALEDLDALPDGLGFGALTPRSPDAATRTALATVSAAIEPALTSLLASPDSKVRVHALSVLTKAIGPRAEAALLRALDAPELAVRDGAMSAIGQLARRNPLPQTLRAGLLRVLASPRWPDRRAAALAIGRPGADADIGALATAAGDRSSFVREAVATSLGAIASPATIDTLIQLSHDEVPEVRAAAARALRSLGDVRARKRVEELRRDPDLDVRVAAGA